MLTAPAYLTGIDQKQHRTLYDLACEQFAGEDVQARADLDRAIARVERSAHQLTEILAPRIREWRGNDDRILQELR